jgi:hypothetical protein
MGSTSKSVSTAISDLEQINSDMSFLSSSQSSISNHVVSGYVPTEDRGQVVQMTAWAPGMKVCWGILQIKAPIAKAKLLQGKRQPGTYFFAARGPSCAAAKVRARTIEQFDWPLGP